MNYRCFWGSRFFDCWRNRLIRLNMVRITLVFGILVKVLLFWIQLDAAVVVAKVHLQLWWFLFNYGYLFNRLVPFLKICLNLGYNFFRIFLYFHFLVCILQTVELFDCFSTPKAQFFHQQLAIRCSFCRGMQFLFLFCQIFRLNSVGVQFILLCLQFSSLSYKFLMLCLELNDISLIISYLSQ